MIAYVDSSVVLRVVLGQPDRLGEWNAIELGVASALVGVECLRTLDRLRLSGRISDEELASRREAVYRLTEEIAVVELSETVLERASGPLTTPLGTVEALHLTTALLWRESRRQPLVVATHDGALAVAARAFGFHVIGV